MTEPEHEPSFFETLDLCFEFTAQSAEASFDDVFVESEGRGFDGPSQSSGLSM